MCASTFQKPLCFTIVLGEYLTYFKIDDNTDFFTKNLRNIICCITYFQFNLIHSFLRSIMLCNCYRILERIKVQRNMLMIWASPSFKMFSILFFLSSNIVRKRISPNSHIMSVVLQKFGSKSSENINECLGKKQKKILRVFFQDIEHLHNQQSLAKSKQVSIL